MSMLAKLGLFLAGVFALVALAWMIFLPAVVEHELRSVTGFDFHVSVLTANPFTGRVVVKGLAANNPAGYPKPEFVQLRELNAEVEVFSWLVHRRYEVDNLDLNIETIVLMRRHDGKTNAGDFMAAFKPHEPLAAPAVPATPAQPTRYLLKRLHLSLGKLVVADYSGSKLDEKSYNLHIDQTYTNVTSARQLLVPDVLQRLRTFGLHHDIARLLPGDFGKALAGAVGGATQGVHEVMKKTGETIKGMFDKLEQSPKQ